MTWEWYQKRIAEFFHRVPGARVAENVYMDGKSGVRRQLDVQILLPMQVKLSEAIKVTVDIHIIVDAKRHQRPVDIGLVGQINDLRDDVGAHLAIIVSPIGFTQGARKRAPKVSVFPLVVTSDLLAMLDKVEIPWPHRCHSYACDHDSNVIDWHLGRIWKDGTVLGNCQVCNTLHVLCPDCGMVFFVHEVDEGKLLKCCGCERIYRVGRNEHGQEYGEVREELDVLLMREAYENQSKQITKGKAEKIIGATKWQHAKNPTDNLVTAGLMEWTGDGDFLQLTEEGIEEYENSIQNVEEASE